MASADHAKQSGLRTEYESAQREFNERQMMPQLPLETRPAIQQQQQMQSRKEKMSPPQIGGSPWMEPKIADGRLGFGLRADIV